MFWFRKPFAAWWATVPVLAVLSSCSSQPAPPATGTPAFYWQAARETFGTGDYTKTLEHLDNLLATDNDYTARALPWSLVLKSGLAEGYMELADHYAAGARVNKADPSAFRRQTSDLRNFANRLALAFAQDFGTAEKLKDPVPLAFAYPKGSALPVPELARVAGGFVLPQPEAEALQRRVLERDVLLAASRAAGAADNTAKTEQILKSENASVPLAVFLEAMAENLYDQSQLYTRDRLDDPGKLAIFCQRAQEALKKVPESKATKELGAKIAGALKKSK